MNSLIGRKAEMWDAGKMHFRGEIVFVTENVIWLLMESGFVLKCEPSSIKVLTNPDNAQEAR